MWLARGRRLPPPPPPRRASVLFYPVPVLSGRDRRRFCLKFCLLVLLILPARGIREADTTTLVAFGSCSKTTEKQPMWDVINGRPRAPDAFVFAGDNVYADVNQHPLRSPTATAGLQAGERPRFVPRPRAEHKAMYEQQRRVPGYARMVQSDATVGLGTWDDHDAGINDADRYFAFKDERQSLFLDFFDVPKDSPRRARKGVYHAHVLTDAKGRTVKIILLDVRYHRDPWPWHVGAVDPDNSDVLGEAQWSWLSDQLLGDDAADLNLLVSGFQVLPVTLLDITKHETWWHFMGARQRLFDILHRSRGPALLLSGDVHFAEVSACEQTNTFDNANKTVVEFTSSGLTHAWAGSPLNWPRPLAMALLFRYAWILWDWIGVNPWRLAAYPNLNYGEIEINHDTRTLHLRVISQDGESPVSMTVQFDALPGGGGNGNGAGFVGAPCRPVNGEPSPARLRVAALTMAAIPLLAMLVVAWAFVRLGARCLAGSSTREKMM